METPYELAVSTVIRNSKGTVIERVITRFREEQHYKKFIKILSDHTKLEFYTVNIRKAAEPQDRRGPKGTLWCPYCSDWRKFHSEGDGYKRCEICTISNQDFYTKAYNTSLGLMKKEE